MKQTADVVVIGGGIMGASTAFHLARRGADVVLLERADMFGTGATGWNAGGIRHQFSTAVNIELSRHSIAMLERFGEEMGQAVDLNLCGYLFLLDNDRDVAAFRRNIELQHRHGVGSRFVEVDDIRRLAPALDLDGVIGGTFYERDGIADPSGTLQGYISQARRLGATLLTGTAVTGIRIESGRVRGVTTTQGSIGAPCVVIAAGPWSADVGRLAGIELPVAPIRRQIMVTRPIPGGGVTRDFPFIIDFSRALYFHHESGGVLTGMSNPDQAPGFDTSVDQEWREVHLAAAMRRLPLLADAAIASEWAGLYEVTPDDQPILGRLPQAEGLVSCTGFSGHGFMHGPVAGLLMAEEILDGRAHTVDIDLLRWQRFESGVDVGEYNVV